MSYYIHQKSSNKILASEKAFNLLSYIIVSIGAGRTCKKRSRL